MAAIGHRFCTSCWQSKRQHEIHQSFPLPAPNWIERDQEHKLTRLFCLNSHLSVFFLIYELRLIGGRGFDSARSGFEPPNLEHSRARRAPGAFQNRGWFHLHCPCTSYCGHYFLLEVLLQEICNSFHRRNLTPQTDTSLALNCHYYSWAFMPGYPDPSVSKSIAVTGRRNQHALGRKFPACCTTTIILFWRGGIQEGVHPRKNGSIGPPVYTAVDFFHPFVWELQIYAISSESSGFSGLEMICLVEGLQSKF